MSTDRLILRRGRITTLAALPITAIGAIAAVGRKNRWPQEPFAARTVRRNKWETSMQQKLQTRAFDQVAPILQAGEQPITATRAMVGKFASGRLGAVALQGLVLEGGGAALSATLAASRKQFVVVTNRRVIFLNQTLLGGPGKKVLGEVPRGQVALAEVKFATVSLLRLAFGNPGDGVSLTFPRVDKKNAEALAQALQQAPVA